MNDDEWANADQVLEKFGLSRGTLLKLAEQGKIKSSYIKTRADARKGVRLFELDSIRRLLSETIK
jgi:hypothetical protein